MLAGGGLRRLVDSARRLLSSRNFKVRAKILQLLRLVVQLGHGLPLLWALGLAKALLSLLGTMMGTHRDSKLQYYALINVGLLSELIVSRKLGVNCLQE